MFRLTSSAEKFQSHDALRAALEKLRREVLLLLHIRLLRYYFL